MPAVLPFLPLLASGVGVAGSLISGNQADQRNQQQLAMQQQGITSQQNIIQQIMAGISPSAYQQQAANATADGQNQIDTAFAQRGMAGSGAQYAAGLQAATKNYADANANYQRDRMSAYGMALTGQRDVSQQYGQNVNQNPYGGLGAALGGLGTAAGAFAQQMAGPQQQMGSMPLAGFGGSANGGQGYYGSPAPMSGGSGYYSIPGYGRP